MRRDPLAVLSRLRGIALDAARRELADRLRHEAAAAARAAALAAEQSRESEAQRAQPAAMTGDDYAAWLHRMQGVRQQAAAAIQATAAATDGARQSVNLARTEARALEAALDQAQERRSAATARQQQTTLDEAAARCGETRR